MQKKILVLLLLAMVFLVSCSSIAFGNDVVVEAEEDHSSSDLLFRFFDDFIHSPMMKKHMVYHYWDCVN